MIDMTTESQQFDEILIGDFTECGWELPLKSVFLFNWYLKRCIAFTSGLL